jgi:dipeptidyl aminopeptidase/acylaminoacyl peptidase
VDFETARLDIWNYKEDYLQPQQQVQLNQELRKSYTAVIFPKDDNIFMQLGTDTTESVQLVNEGNANYVLSTSSYGNRAASQWLGFTKQTAYVKYMDVTAAKAKPSTIVFKNERSNASASPMGKYILWYDWDKKSYFTFNVANGKKANISQGIKAPIWDEDDDHPDAPPPHGVMQWDAEDKWIYIYDKYDVWKCDPQGIIAPVQLSNGRKNKTIVRWVNTDREERFLQEGKPYLFNYFSEENKQSDVQVIPVNELGKGLRPYSNTTYRGYLRAKDSIRSFIYTCENPQQSPYLVSYESNPSPYDKFNVKILHEPNPQQADYNWYTTELESWKMFDGKRSEGILYKPENFDPAKKYPIIFYFYERDADDLYNYRGPAPSASTINIPYFTSNGYLVFDPNIYYKNGEPGESAYNSVVSAAKYLTKKYKWVDSTKMAIQGQSWGGYQVAYLVTRTNIFAAAGAGAPVSNMTSAYGGIRWGSGVTRQFQYEKGQTRIGKTLWEGRDLYLKNSPLFAVPKIKTPLLLMHNDKDGAVPWYQSIEFFTALKRNDKKVWLLQYNDEDHNLIERRNRKDLSIRLAQFFDHYLKGKPMPKWMAEGVPAVEKGVEWGL